MEERSPDGKWIAYTDKDHNLYIRSATTGEVKQLSKTGDLRTTNMQAGMVGVKLLKERMGKGQFILVLAGHQIQNGYKLLFVICEKEKKCICLTGVLIHYTSPVCFLIIVVHPVIRIWFT